MLLRLEFRRVNMTRDCTTSGEFSEAATSLSAANNLQPSDELAIELARVNSLRSRLEEGIAAYNAEDYSRARVVLVGHRKFTRRTQA